MNEFIICTDSACDIKPDVLAKWNVPFKDLTFCYEDSDKEYKNSEVPVKDFYDGMREGKIAKTSAVNIGGFLDLFEPIVKEGKDILYLGFSSGLSTTFNSGKSALAELSEKYPDRKLIAIDSLAAAAGFGMLLYLAVEKKNSGASIEETAEYINANILKLCHWFTVDDLVYLKRGGRVSPTVAFVGGILGIKPVLHVDDEGHLINKFTVRGRKAAVNALAKKYDELAEDPENGIVFISHADCEKDAKALAEILKNDHGVETKLITDVGTVIGAHSGPGTLALFFIGKNR